MSLLDKLKYIGEMQFAHPSELKAAPTTPMSVDEPKPVPTQQEWADHVRFLLKAGAITKDTAEEWLQKFGHLPKAEAVAEIEGTQGEAQPKTESQSEPPAETPQEPTSHSEPPVVDLVTGVEHVAHALEPHKEEAMEAEPVTPAPSGAQKFFSALKKIEQGGFALLAKLLPAAETGLAKVEEVAVEAEPFVELLFPAEGVLYDSVVRTILTMQVALPGSGKGAGRFQAVYDMLSPQMLASAQKVGLESQDAEAAVKRFLQAVFDIWDGPAKQPIAAPVAA